MSDIKLPEPFVPFNPNAIEEDVVPTAGVAHWPVFKNVTTVDQYASVFAQGVPSQGTDPGSIEAFIKSTIEVAKASPPDMRTWSQQYAIMPDPQADRLMAWPGLAPQMIRMLIEQHLSPKMIIGLRTADLMRYSAPSTRPWAPGWTITTREGIHTPTSSDEADKKQATNFLLNCTTETTDARVRDGMDLTSFATFLEMAIRDAMTYGAYAWWTDTDLRGRVKSFKCLSAYNIRLANKEGYKGDPSVFAVGVDDSNHVKQAFTRHDLVWRPRNPRPDANVGLYGYSEIEMALKLIQGWSDALEMNVTTFSKSAIPPGILTVTGMWTPRQLDTLSKVWQNLKRGITKIHSLPVIALPRDGEIKLLSLDTMVSKDVQFGGFLNLLAGALCAVYRFPPDRLGVFISGQAKDNKPEGPVVAANVDVQDPGLAPELLHLQNLINEYLVTPRWPHLEFCFTARDPKNDARAYELRILSMVQDERRAMVDLPKLEDIAAPEDKELARIMGKSPVDPGMIGLYSNVVTARIAAETAIKTATAKPDSGAAFTSKKDPGVAQEEHGHTGGVRRDSAAEEKSAKD